MINFDKINLIGLSYDEISQELLKFGIPKSSIAMRASQIWHWLYFRGAKKFNEMSSISKELQLSLDHVFEISRPNISNYKKSKDGTQKWLVEFDNNSDVETVYIPESDRGSLCISSQVGCILNCSFCYTGTMPLVRNLKASEIVSQFLIARDSLFDWPEYNNNRFLSNIIMMGMGEPLYNYEEVLKSLKIFMDPNGINISKRKITLSTAGVIPMIDQLGKDLAVGLAISLHAVNDELRNELVPINKKYPLKELIKTLSLYPQAKNSRRITFEYVMLRGINDSEADARALCKLISGIPAKINLIPFNPWPNSPYECSSKKAIESFSNIINKAGYSSPIRRPRGRDIMAACGQLKSESERMKNRKH